MAIALVLQFLVNEGHADGGEAQGIARHLARGVDATARTDWTRQPGLMGPRGARRPARPDSNSVDRARNRLPDEVGGRYTTIRVECRPVHRRRMKTLAVGSARGGHSSTRGHRIDRQARPPALALAIALAWVGGVGATPLEQGGGTPLGVRRAVHVSHASTNVRVDAVPQVHRGAAEVVANG